MLPGEIQAITFSGDLPNIKYMALWKRSYLNYIAIIHKAILVSSGNRSSRPSSPMGLLFVKNCQEAIRLGEILGYT